MRKIVSSFMALAVLGGTLAPVVSFAQTSGTSSTNALLLQISALLKQLNTLQAQVDTLKSQQKEVAGELKDAVKELRSEMEPGSKGEMVEILQALLASDPDIYPDGLITGYFGALTKKAVQKFQAKHGLSTQGRVGPKTLKKLNELLKKNPLAFETANSADDDNDNDDDKPGREIGKKNRLCAVVPPGHLIAPGWLKKHGGERPVILACQTLPPGIGKKLTGSSTPPWTGTSTTTSTPDTVAPTISGISVSASSTSATFVFTSNESAVGKVYYGTVTPLSLTATSTLSISDSGTTSHSIPTGSLTASTTYYYVVEAKDAANNVSTAAEASFTTAQ